MSSRKLLSVIIVNYNTGPLTEACIESILATVGSRRVEIIVIDNASSDGSKYLIKADFPEVKLVSNKRNVGLAAGVNQGMAAAGGRYYLILNPDVIVLPGSILSMMKFLEGDRSVGVVGGKLLTPTGRLQYSCYRFYSPMTIVYRRTRLGKTSWGKRAVARFLMKDYDHNTVRDVQWLMGACLMVRAEAVSQVGGMDERFFLYFEDVDWCRRFWRAGWRVVYLPTAKFSHYHQRSSEQRGMVQLIVDGVVREHIKSAVKYFWKYRGEKLPTVEG